MPVKHISRHTPYFSKSASYRWMAARARNALRRPGLIGITGGVAFIVSLVALVLVPKRAAHLFVVTPETAAEHRHSHQRIDSTKVLNAIKTAAAKIAVADSVLTVGRQAASLPPERVDTIPPHLLPVRDSLQRLIDHLSTLITRAQNAPLPTSYRLLGTSPLLVNDPVVQSKLDTLVMIEREREAFGAVGGADPVYAALTARANGIGRDIRVIGAKRVAELRAQIAPLLPVAVTLISPIAVDTLRQIGERVAAEQAFLAATRQLDSIRQVNAQIDFEEKRSRDMANEGAPPLAMLGAAVIIALASGFGFALLLEYRTPKVSDAHEAEHVAGTRVLAVVEPREEVIDRSRRQTDVEGPPLIDVISESYRTLYLHLAATEQSVPIVTITGDEPTVVATVAANLAAASAYEARNTLLVDLDPTTCAVASVLRIRPDPGFAGILTETAHWSEVIVSTTIGRDRPLDVLPSGTKKAGPGVVGVVPSAHVAERIREEFARMERRYDFIVLAAPTSYVQRGATSIIPAPDVVLCAHMAHTPLADLKTSVESLRGADMTVHGIVLWDDNLPTVQSMQLASPTAHSP